MVQEFVTTCTLAGITAEVHHNYPKLTGICRDYPAEGQPDITLTITDQDIRAEQTDEDEYPPAYLETLAFYRQFCSSVADRGIILFHSVAMECDGKCYLFSAPSGTGKSTHAGLWLRNFSGRVSILNGDKPLIDVSSGSPTVYGTPFMGKENYGRPGSAPLAGICFLHRSPVNEISRLQLMDAFQQGYVQAFMPKSPEAAKHVLTSLTAMLAAVPCWSLGCNISDEAAKLSFETMTGGKA